VLEENVVLTVTNYSIWQDKQGKKLYQINPKLITKEYWQKY